jgi:monofunctional biosynthetic peptidoglycan transglycosylase
MLKSRNRIEETPRFLRYVTTTLGIAMLVSITLTLPWRWLTPPTTAFILQDRFHHKSRIYQRWVPFDEISPALPIAVVAAEDQKFPHHHGFDFQSLSEALQEGRRHRRGASTISQQLAKNLYLWPGRSVIRKALEAYFTVLIEFTWPKRRILEVYLNVVEFGPRVYGVDAASRFFFGKQPSRITSQEAALLAAVLPSPKRMSVLRPSEYVRKRVSEIEEAVRALGGPEYLAGL